MLYEVKHPEVDIARKYVDEIEKFNVRTRKIDESLPKTLRNQSILMNGQELYDILDRFKSDVRTQVATDMKRGINYIDPVTH